MWRYLRTLLSVRIKMLCRPSPGGRARSFWVGVAGATLALLCMAAAMLLALAPLVSGTRSESYLRPTLLWLSTAGVTFLFLLTVPGMLRSLTSRGDLRLLLLAPVPSWWVVLEKLISSYLGALGMALLPTATVVLLFGLRSHTSWSYWLLGVMTAILLPAVPLSLSTLLTVAVLRWVPPARARTLASILGAGLGLAYYVGSQLLASSQTYGALGSARVVGLLGNLPTSWPGQVLLLALEGDELRAVAYLLGMAGVALVAGALGMWLSVRSFETGWASFQEATSGRRGVSVRPLRPMDVRRPRWWALASKDWKELRRDPQELVRLIYPLVIFGFGIYRSLSSASSTESWIVFGTIDLGLYFLVMTLALPAINREGRALYLLALCPISSREVFLGKWLYAALPPLALAVGLDLAYGLWAGVHPLTVVYVAADTALLAVVLSGALLWVSATWPRLEGQGNRVQASFTASTVGGAVNLLLLATVALPALSAIWLWSKHPLVALPLGALPMAVGGAAVMSILALAPLQVERLLRSS